MGEGRGAGGFNSQVPIVYCVQSVVNRNKGGFAKVNKQAWQAQTLPDATPPIGKIHPIRKMILTFEPLMGFDALRDLESS